MFKQGEIRVFQDNREFGKICNTRLNGWLWIEVKQAMDVPSVATEWYELYVSLQKTSSFIGKSKQLWCFSSNKCDFLAYITMTGLLLVRLS